MPTGNDRDVCLGVYGASILWQALMTDAVFVADDVSPFAPVQMLNELCTKHDFAGAKTRRSAEGKPRGTQRMAMNNRKSSLVREPRRFWS